MTASDEAMTLAKGFVDGLSRRDPAALLAIVHDDFVMEAAFPLVHGEDQTGARRCAGEAVRSFLRNFPKGLSKLAFHDVVWRTTSDGLVLFEANGEMNYADGRPYNNIYLWFFEISDGKILRLREYFSPVIWARACGIPLENLP
jgi:ketosteroid isomerase-like protein